jgi:hypothetical protein
MQKINHLALKNVVICQSYNESLSRVFKIGNEETSDRVDRLEFNPNN